MIDLVIFGAGDIAEIALHFFLQEKKYHIKAFTVDRPFLKPDFKGYPMVAFEDLLQQYPPGNTKLFIAVSYNGLNQLRADKFAQAKDWGYDLVSYIHSKATLADNAVIGQNCFIFEDNTIQPFVTIGDNVTLWSGNHIGHHSRIGNHCFITSHVVVSGGVEIGEYSFLGVNATLRDHIKIGQRNVIGAGSLIMDDTNDNEVYISQMTKLYHKKSDQIRL